MIKSKIFKNICHIDTIFRYINEYDIKPPPDCDCSDERVLELGRLCIKNNVSVEYNLSGAKFPIGRSFPSKEVIMQLKKEGARIFIGSDSHFVPYFQEQIKHIKNAYKLLDLI
jgi:histidinol phosphatase-like PHP family hydrolase